MAKISCCDHSHPQTADVHSHLAMYKSKHEAFELWYGLDLKYLTKMFLI